MSESSKGSANGYHGVTTSAADVAVDVLFVPVTGPDDKLSDVAWIDGATRGEVGRARSSGECLGRLFDVYATPVTGDGSRARRIALVGGGNPSERTPERWRRIGASCAYAARRFKAGSCGVIVRGAEDAVMAAQHLADGFSAPDFDGGVYKDARADVVPSAPSSVVVIAHGTDGTALSDAVRRGRVIGESANFTRSLANEPANVLTPEEFANRVARAAAGVGLRVDVLEEDRIAELGMRLFLSVSQGSALPPRLIVLRHEPEGAPASPVLALVGKGITFDTGGVSIKPAEGMERMKDDMAGGAAVAGAMLALARLRASHHVIGIIPTCENAIGGRASRPGDVVRGASGKTVEIINTDAEGRLILGDALWYAQQLGATHMVNVATLTGAIMVALGRYVSGLFGQPDAWVETVRAAGERGGDRLWPMPIYEEAREQLRSEIADMINSAGRPGGAVTAAAFLREFAGDIPWAHLDIAGTAWAESKENYQPKGATGVALRTLVALGMTGGRRSS
ncbi:MAG TPA: leucyl aminopeptidase [Vicinamibacterales bacterium]|nr:leucyl aminopeptidase [Vicinamibacterales bacterium]